MYFSTITEYIEHIFIEFQNEIESMDSLCDLENVSFEGGNLPDYDDRAQALIYCLRYHFGYAFEYEYIYNNHILNSFTKNSINVLSVGCGNGIDLWSLNNAIRRSQSSIQQINYWGIDQINWKEYFHCTKQDNIKYLNCAVQDLSDCIPDIDVVIFPKSLSEMNIADLLHIADIIDNNTNNLFVVASFRVESINLKRDINKFDDFINLLSNKDFNISIGKSDIYSTIDGPNAIISNYSDYDYPDRAIDYISRLYEYCESRDDDYRCQNLCPEYITRLPILTTKHIRYNIVKLTRS